MQNPLVAHINLARGFRGGERQTELLIRGLAARGWCQRLVARRGEPLVERLGNLANLAVFPVGWTVVEAAVALRGADLVHVHEGRGVQAAWLVHLFGGAAYVITRRVLRRPSRHWLNLAMYRGAGRIAVLSAAVGEAMTALDPALRFEVIPSAHANLAATASRAAEIRRRYGGAFLVGHVGALLDRDKGQRQIIAVARELARMAPEVTFLLVGAGPDEAALREEARSLRNLQFAGQIRDVGNYLAAFDVFLYPSRHEGLGSVLLDAMAFGLPIVATGVGGIPEIVRHGINGLLCEIDDIAGLTAALLTLRADAELRQRMGATNRERAKQFSPEGMTERYIGMYRSVLAGAAEMVNKS